VTRLAVLSPLPPSPSGIADYVAEVGAILADRHEVDCFHAQAEADRSRLTFASGVFHVSELPRLHRERPYDLVVHQMGNSMEHAFIYDHLARFPGLLVLHDLVLMPSRARTFLDSEEARAYRADPGSSERRSAAQAQLGAYREELDYSYPGLGARLAEVHLGTMGQLLPYAYPLFRIPVECSRATAVHNRFMLEAVREELPAALVVQVPMPVTPLPVAPGAAAAVRRRLGLADDQVIVACFGLATREKRIDVAARAVARASAACPALRLLLVGGIPDRPWLDALLSETGIADRTVVTGRVPFGELAAHMHAVDVALALRYPTGGETSAALLRLLAQGRPVVASDLANVAEVPEGAMLRADLADEEGEVTRAILRLAASQALRERQGQAGRAYAAREHSPARCASGYEEAIALALEAPEPPERAWPAHWRA
jgi:glycosyltransferase involved in cell wall biosynthesis